MRDKIYLKVKSLYSRYGVQRAECTEQINVPLMKRAAAESEGRVGGQLESKKFVDPTTFSVRNLGANFLHRLVEWLAKIRLTYRP